MSDMLIISVAIIFGCGILYEGCKEIKKGLIGFGKEIKEGLVASKNRDSKE